MADAAPAHFAGAPPDLARNLAPLILEVTNGRLADLRWFRADWQRGGASTAYGTWTDESGAREVVVKLPIGPREHRLTTVLGAVDGPTPRVAAHGETLGGYDLAWVVMERVPGDPMSRDLKKQDLVALADAAARFCALAEAHLPPPPAPGPTDWGALIARARDAVRANDVPESQRWNNALRGAQKHLSSLVTRWRAREMTGWRHGDLHPGNAMRRPEGSSWGPAGCVLIDFAEAGGGHWVEDAVYLERLHWGRMETLHGVKFVKLLARARKKHGLKTPEGYAELANIRRTLLAACVPAFLEREGAPRYLAGALETLERIMPLVTS